jgi:hypothetical protein
MDEKKEENRETYLKNKRELLSLRGVVPLFLLFRCGVKLAHIGGYVRAPAKSHELGVYESGSVGYLSCARGSCVSYSGRGIHHGVRGVLRVRIQSVITPISPPSAMVLQPRPASLDPPQGSYIWRLL